MRRRRRLAHRAQHQPGAALVQEPDDAGAQQHRHIDHRMLTEQCDADKRNIGQQGHGELRILQAVADIAHADVSRRAAAEQRKRQPRRVLVGAEPDGEQREETREQHAGQCAGDETHRDAAAVHRGSEADDGRHQHHAFRAEIDHAGFFVDQQAQRCQHQRRACVDRRGDQRSEGFHVFLQTGLKWMRMSQASREKSRMPWNTPVMALGMPRRDCESSPPM